MTLCCLFLLTTVYSFQRTVQTTCPSTSAGHWPFFKDSIILPLSQLTQKAIFINIFIYTAKIVFLTCTWLIGAIWFACCTSRQTFPLQLSTVWQESFYISNVGQGVKALHGMVEWWNIRLLSSPIKQWKIWK